uniref:Uncharacterized protein n=1 Tax=Rhizophora mucronata TaxID=61149 RepID=A0A2P2N240_RHIMU
MLIILFFLAFTFVMLSRSGKAKPEMTDIQNNSI